ncbi:uncharacterized protein LOC104904521 [Beta vulgaris subsp. vulgaris]|uniref:uncharacterized protein LOC104904521 n=1 Tax=Beta vulgaris subsp. vulgaris TaxID=3555 RepID=UPI002036DFF2|nr:uncharacterized protein LOC104904521 [Beta vulgaris subsp. vulgaris]
MERVSINLLALAVLGMFFLLSTATAPVLGSMVTNSEDMQFSEEYKMIIEELAAKRQPNIYKNGNQKRKMMITRPIINTLDVFAEAIKKQEIATSLSYGKDLSCVSAGSYCNVVFGPNCCSSEFACVPLGFIGGVCVS